MSDLFAWKFHIREREEIQLPSDPAQPGITTVIGPMVAVAIAETQQQALELLTRLDLEEGDDPRWLAVARVVRLPLDRPCRLCYASV